MNAIASRRDILKGGALVVALSFAPPLRAQTAKVAAKTVDPTQVDAYLAVHADGTVTIYSGKVDLGTGLRAAFPQIAAEELGLPIARIRLVEGDTDTTPDQAPTSGSNGIAKGGMQLRQAAATARQALVRMGAEKLGKPAADLDAIDGEIRPKAGGAGVSFAVLLADKSFDMKLDSKAPVRRPDTFRYVGKHVKRPDVPAKVMGSFVYAHNFELPGMLHGRVVRPPSMGAALETVEESSVSSIPGVQVVRLKNFLGVVAPDEWDAIRASRMLKATWSGGGLPATSDNLADWVRTRAASLGDETLDKRGDFEPAFAGGAKKLTADFYWPAQSHASLGPSCAVADVSNGEAKIWCSSQGTHRYRKHFATMLDIPTSKTSVYYLDGAGCYGMNGHEDAAADAAFLSRAVGKPVRVQWMREDEHGLDPKGPPQVITQEAALSPEGKIVAWRTQMWVPKATEGLPTIPLLSPAETGSKQTPGMGTGSVSQGGTPVYDVPNQQTLVHWLKETPLRPSHLRAPGKIGNLLAVETFMDEMALEAGRDPLAFRLEYLSDPRGRECLQRAAALFGWDARVQPRRDGKGRGIAYTQYKGNDTYVAMAMEVEVDGASGRVRVTRVAAAQDCGQIISPDGVRAQVEGCILQTIGRTLFEEVKFNSRNVTSRDWASYPILTFPDVPDLKIDLIDRPNEPPIGSGEGATAPVAAALANAVFDATGVRLRNVPFTAQRVKAAMLEGGARHG
ncbi:MAG: carbon monoxide dehydrogenase [Hyphomicrobiales bacterium]|nr:carbon monoxide dehydrogenase [Hyphomicrobiales bacterium]